MRKIRKTKQDIIIDAVSYMILIIVLISTFYPLYFVVIASISDPDALYFGEAMLYPVRITFEGYRRILNDKSIWLGYRNTVFYTVVGTFVNIVMTFITAYPLSRKNFPFKKIVMRYFAFTIYFSGGLIPTYLLVKSLYLIDKWYVMVILGAMSVFNVIVTRTFFQSTIPEELYESASMDGCNHFTFFARVVIPLSKPVLAVMVLFYGVRHWNEFFKAMIYLNDRGKYPLQVFLREVLINNSLSEDMHGDNMQDRLQSEKLLELMKYGTIVVATLPMMVVYPFLQKYFVKGTMIGSLKG